MPRKRRDTSGADIAEMRHQHFHHFLFYSKDIERDMSAFELTGPEHRHLSRVLRLAVGGTAFATNGRGLIVRGKIVATGVRSTDIEVRDIVVDQASGPPVILALACLKKEAFEQAVKQCTELGMTHCIPFVSAKSHVKDYSPAFLDRLRRIALSAMKQSFRPLLPEIEEVITIDGLFQRIAVCDRIIVGEQGAAPPELRPMKGPLMIVVGPEGGFSEEEYEHLTSLDCEFGSVSGNRLRSETAAAALTGVLLSHEHSPGQAGYASIDTE